VYEIEIEEAARGKGIGKYLMNAVYEIAASLHLFKVMLTAFKSNLPALEFYQKMGYELDEISPEIEEEEYSYIILSINAKNDQIN
jgi:ribosomal protein S18 acetylase RimI-like enzyme